MDEQLGAKQRATRRRRRLPALVERTSAWGLGFVVVVSALAIGTVHPETLLFTAVCVGALFAITTWFGAAPRGGLLPLPAWGLLCLAAYSALQALPLPLGLLGHLSSTSAEIWRSAVPNAAATAGSLSLDPGASAREALKWLTYALVFSVAVGVGQRRGARWGVAVVFVSGVVVAALTLGHGLADSRRLYGFYETRFATATWHVGPLLNPNNLAGYMILSSLGGFGLLASRRRVGPRWLTALGVLLVVAQAAATASRAGVALLIFGLGFYIWRVRKMEVWMASKLAIGGGILGVTTVALLIGWLGLTHRATSELFAKDVAKVQLSGWAGAMIQAHPWFGIGRGAFESAFPAYKLGSDNLVFSSPENFLTTWACEWGLPITLCAVVFFAACFWPARFPVKTRPLALAIFVGIFALLAQNMVDLALEIPAVCLALCCLLGALWGEYRSEHAWLPLGRLQGRVLAGVGAALVVVLSGVVVLAGRQTVLRDRDLISEELRGLKRGDSSAGSELRENLLSAIARHPADPYFPRAAATMAQRVGNENPMPWIERALERGVGSGRTHFILARELARRGAKQQALLELKFAVVLDPELKRAVARSALALAKTLDELKRAIPDDGPLGAALLSSMASQLPLAEDASLREQLLREAVRRDARDVAGASQLALDLVGAMTSDPPAARCEGVHRADCEQEARSLLERVQRHAPDSWRAVELEARLHLVAKRPSEAALLLGTRCVDLPEREPCEKLRVLAALESRSPELLQVASRGLQMACGATGRCASAMTWLGQTLAARAQWASAAKYYADAAEEEPSGAHWLRLARARLNAGTPRSAAQALARAEAGGARDPELRQKIDLTLRDSLADVALPQ